MDKKTSSLHHCSYSGCGNRSSPLYSGGRQRVFVCRYRKHSINIERMSLGEGNEVHLLKAMSETARVRMVKTLRLRMSWREREG